MSNTQAIRYLNFRFLLHLWLGFEQPIDLLEFIFDLLPLSVNGSNLPQHLVRPSIINDPEYRIMDCQPIRVDGELDVSANVD